MKNLLSFSDYKTYLLSRLGRPGTRTGQRKKAAAHIGIQTTHLSNVLNGHSHLSLEQAHGFNEFLGHTNKEARYFLLLVQKAKAGTHQLKNLFQEQIREFQQEFENIRSRVPESKQLTGEQKATYYNAWYYSAVHVALTLPSCRTQNALAEYLGLSVAEVSRVLDFMLAHGLVSEKNGEYTIGDVYTHLGHDEEQAIRHHMNWRSEAMSSLSRSRQKDLHYSMVYSCSESVAKQIRENLLQVIANNMKLIRPSKEEVLYCNTLDFFDLKKSQ